MHLESLVTQSQRIETSEQDRGPAIPIKTLKRKRYAPCEKAVFNISTFFPETERGGDQKEKDT